MNLDPIILFGMVTFIAFAPLILAMQLTRLAHSSYRNRLWLVRDRLADDIRTGGVSRSTAAETIYHLLEKQIQVAGRHTLKDTILAIAIFEVDGETSIFREIYAEIPPADVEKLALYLQEIRAATVSHLRWGSVLGWFAVPGFKMLKRVLRLWLRLRHTPIPAQRVTGQSIAIAREDEPDTVEMKGMDTVVAGNTVIRGLQERTFLRAGEMTQKLERAEVEIMPDAAPNRHVRNVKEQEMAGC
ncbi:hypothetical protein O7627_30430 [Solwaraspora sp. WMMD1047]|uniref:hypothetical protein n=1 Tax=Solwaraspora sp. WMMD1047 TaxID=3016102 RepID=UPI0024164543|nr:hypothetical protein [Solwaraspora sp. WMMD1047]MDG4833593.1 hypothetical protein [Solwaraspora sp. WMMD1047]